MARAPAISGNEINGLGETTQRAPEVVYWAPDPDDIPHGDMQRWFYTRDPDDPHIAKARAERAGREAAAAVGRREGGEVDHMEGVVVVEVLGQGDSTMLNWRGSSSMNVAIPPCCRRIARPKPLEGWKTSPS